MPRSAAETRSPIATMSPSTIQGRHGRNGLGIFGQRQEDFSFRVHSQFDPPRVFGRLLQRSANDSYDIVRGPCQRAISVLRAVLRSRARLVEDTTFHDGLPATVCRSSPPLMRMRVRRPRGRGDHQPQSGLPPPSRRAAISDHGTAAANPRTLRVPPCQTPAMQQCKLKPTRSRPHETALTRSASC